MKHQNLAQEIIDIKGSSIDLGNLKYRPIMGHEKSRLTYLKNELKKMENTISNEWKQFYALIVEVKKNGNNQLYRNK